MITGGNDCVFFEVFSQVLHHFTLIGVKFTSREISQLTPCMATRVHMAIFVLTEKSIVS